MSKEIKVVRPYTAKLAATGDRLKYLQETFAYLKSLEHRMYNFIASLCGGMDKSLVRKFYAEESKEKEDVFLAMLLFRVVPINMTTTNNYISPKNLAKLYQKYTGLTPNQSVDDYFSSNIDVTTYAWQDCRSLFESMAKATGLTTTELTDFLKAYISHGVFIGCDEKAARNAICQLFGEGKKSDTANKAKMCEQTLKALESSKTWEELRTNILKLSGNNTANEFANNYGTSNSTAVYLVSGSETGLISDSIRKVKITKLIQDYKKHSGKIPLPHVAKIRQYIVNGSTVPYNYDVVVMAYRNAIAETNSKFSNNINYVVSKAKIREEIESKEKENVNLINAVTVIHKWMQSMPEENRYIPAPYHFGPLAELFDSLPRTTNVEQTIDQFIEDNSDNFNRRPVKSLLATIAPHHKDMQAKDFIDASFVMKLSEKYNKLSSHPYLSGNNPYTWGPQSAIYGYVTPPLHLLGKAKILAGSNPTMWVEATLLDKGNWIKHHLPFGNSRYFEEIYYTDPSLPTKKEARIPKHGFTLKNDISDEAKKEASLNPNRNKAAITVARIKANSTYNVEWDDTTSFNIRQVDGEFYITVNHRHKTTPVKALNIGDRILGFDQNQTAATTYSIIELSNEGPDTIPYKGNHYRFIKSGKITHYIQSGKNSYDKLEYLGLPIDGNSEHKKVFDEYKVRCKNFIKSLKDQELYEEYTNKVHNKSNITPFFEAYASMLNKVMRKVGPAKTRHELKRFLLDESLNPISYGSLAMSSIRALRKTMSLINAYFSLSLANRDAAGKNVSPTDVQKEKFDSVLYQLHGKIYKKLVNKRKERVRVQSSKIIRLCVENNVKLVRGEGGLPIAESKGSKQQNATRMDWCARVMAEYVFWGTQVMGIQYEEAPTEYTSHQNPFVHVPNLNVDMRPRYDMVSIKDIKPYHIENLKKYARSKKDSGTAVYYRSATLELCKNLDIDLAKVKYPSDLASTIGDKTILVPKKGGRVYVATHPITSQAKPYNGQYVCDADEVAACNIILTGFKK